MAKTKVPEFSIGSFLQQKRVAAGKSQADVADHFNYSTPQFISNWERDVSAPPISALKKLALFYGISAEELFEVFLVQKVKEVTKELRRKFYGR
jgi:transcriptional regulator with XRE-family HTH domain